MPYLKKKKRKKKKSYMTARENLNCTFTFVRLTLRPGILKLRIGRGCDGPSCDPIEEQLEGLVINEIHREQ